MPENQTPAQVRFTKKDEKALKAFCKHGEACGCKRQKTLTRLFLYGRAWSDVGSRRRDPCVPSLFLNRSTIPASQLLWSCPFAWGAFAMLSTGVSRLVNGKRVTGFTKRRGRRGKSSPRLCLSSLKMNCYDSVPSLRRRQTGQPFFPSPMVTLSPVRIPHHRPRRLKPL